MDFRVWYKKTGAALCDPVALIPQETVLTFGLETKKKYMSPLTDHAVAINQ